ncbi:MAG: phospholipase D-like domain-containing protein [Bacteroidota bacterium]
MKKSVTILVISSCWAIVTNAQTDIADARTFSLGSPVTVTGIVTNGSELGVIRYMEDGTAGIACYPGTGSVSFNPSRGDSITVTGTLVDYNNLLEMNPITAVTVLSSGNTLPTPQLVTPNQIGEPDEAELVQVNSAVFDNGGSYFVGNTNYSFTSNSQSGEVRISSSSNLVGELIPVSTVNIIAITSQYLSTYQLLLRDNNDIITTSTIFFTSPLTVSNITTGSLDLSWTTNISASSNVKYGLTSSFELVDINQGGSTTSHTLSLPGLSPATIYYVMAYSVTGTDTAFSQTKVVATASNSSGEIIVYFNKSVDNTASPVADAISVPNYFADTIIAYIDKAQNTLDICMYNNSNSSIVYAINNAYNRGVSIRYVTDLTTMNSALSSMDANIQVLKGNSVGIMHNKFVVIDVNSQDSSWVITGSTNWTSNNLESDYNNMVIIQDQALARAFTLEFEEFWGSTTTVPNPVNAKFGPDKTDNTPHEFNIAGRWVELYFSPSDNTTTYILNSILSSESDLEFAVLSFTKNELGTGVLDVHNSGSNVKGIIENTNDTGCEYDFLDTNGVDVQSHLTAPFILHHKYCVVDATNAASDPQLVTGAHNWSNAAETSNDENTLIIHDEIVANMYLEEFMARYCELTSCAISSIIGNFADVSCNGFCDGWAEVSVSNGATPYTFQWDDPDSQTANTASGLCAGTYTVKVTDAVGDSVFSTITITEPSILSFGSNSTTATCGIANGTTTITVSGGTSPYSYSWNDPMLQTGSTAYNLTGGIYSVTITDANGCTDSTIISVPATPAVFLDSISINAPSFCGVNDGDATAYVSNGTIPYTYSWNTNPVQITATATGLPAGAFTIIVSDTNGCMDSSDIILNDIGAASLSITNTVMVTCFAGDDGSATVTPSGGTAPYTYLWNDIGSQSNSTATSLTSGTYIVIVTDAVGCTSGIDIEITEPSSIIISSEVASDISCNGFADGGITIAASGGTGTLEYSIDGGSNYPNSTGIFTGLTAGNYDVMVKDENQCMQTGATLTITEPAVIVLDTVVTHVSVYGGNDGAIDITVSGGSGAYTYIWTPGGETTQDISTLSSGVYKVTVTDSSGCLDSLSINITEPPEVGISEIEDDILFNIYPNPNNFHLNIQFNLNRNTNVSISITDIVGKIIHTESLKGKAGINQHQLNIENLSSGIYFIEMKAGEKNTTRKFIVR